MKLKIELNSIDQKLFDELKAHTGFDDDVIFKIALRMYHKKELPQYVRRAKAEEQATDPVMQCKKLNGEFFTDDQGRNACRIKKGALTYTEIL